MNRTLLAAVAALALTATTSLAQEFPLDLTVSGITLGEQIVGDTVDSGMLPNRVLLVEFWGVNCPPCVASLPKLDHIWEENKEKGLLVLGFHSQNATNDQVKSLLSSKGADFPNFVGANVAGANVRGIPHAVLFDHTGKCIYRGSPSGIESKAKEALEVAPNALVAGLELTKAKALADALKAGQPLGKVLKKAQDMAKSKDEVTATEAAKVVEVLLDHANKEIERATGMKETAPSAAYTRLQKTASDFSGTAPGDEAKKLAAEWKKDSTFSKELKAGEMLGQIKQLATKLNGNPASGEAFKISNKKTLADMQAGLQALVKKYKGTVAAKEAEELATQYGLQL